MGRIAWEIDELDEENDDPPTIARRVRVVPRPSMFSQPPRIKRPTLRRKKDDDDVFVEVRDSWLLPGPV